MTVEKRKEYLVAAVSGRPLAAFETSDKAQTFREARAKLRVRTRLFEVETIQRELP